MAKNIGNTWRTPAGRYPGPKGSPEPARGRPGIEIHHSVTKEAKSPAGLAAIVRSIWNYHVRTKGWSDVFYCYFIGSDGSVAEGRGRNRSTSSKVEPVTICLVGDFTTAEPPPAMLYALGALRASLMRSGVGPAITFHRDRGGSSCPGNGAVRLITKWRASLAKPAKPARKPAAKPAPSYPWRTIHARAGDTWGGLALRHYGGERWTGHLHGANVFLGLADRNPNRLAIGQPVALPDRLNPPHGPKRR